MESYTVATLACWLILICTPVALELLPSLCDIGEPVGSFILSSSFSCCVRRGDTKFDNYATDS